MVLRVYNTASDSLEEFKPINEDEVRMYVCGTTDYDYIHLGHARTYVAYDMIVRYLEWKGYDVKYVQNITDVGHLTEEGEDKIEKRAKEERTHPMEIVEFFMREHLENVDDLRIKRPDIMPRATGHLIDMIDAIKDLIDNGFAYESNGSVYFDVNKLDDYGKLSNVDVDELRGAERIGREEDKRNVEDFALWKKAKEDQLMKWESPWGMGFPGWHIECSVMSTKYLGKKFDIHGGAIELSFPHHENEIAQNQGLWGKDPVKYWIHTGLLNVGGEKMSKSKNNYVTVHDALEKHSPEVMRLWILSSHYRSPVDYTEENIKEASDKLEKIVYFFDRLKSFDSSGERGWLCEMVDNFIDSFETKMDKDFNSPEALAELFKFINKANKEFDEGRDVGDVYYVVDKLEEILGIFGVLPKDNYVELEDVAPKLLKIREKLREESYYELADEIRDVLEEIGVVTEDLGNKTLWHKEVD